MASRDRSNAQAAEYVRNAQLLAAQLAKDARDFEAATRLASGLLQAIEARRSAGAETNNATLEQENLARLVLAAVALNRKNTAEAARHYAQVQAAVARRDLRAAGSTDMSAFASAQGGLGQIAPKAGHWHRLLTVMQQAEGAPLAVTAVMQARALIAENRADEGLAIISRLRQAGYAHPDFVALFPAHASSPQSGSS